MQQTKQDIQAIPRGNKRLLSLKIRTSDGSRACRLCVSGSFTFESAVPCPYDLIAIAYAACRYIRHCPELRDPLICRAVRLGLELRRPKKGRDRLVKTQARALGLPGGRALLSLELDQGEILIRRLRILAPGP